MNQKPKEHHRIKFKVKKRPFLKVATNAICNSKIGKL